MSDSEKTMDQATVASPNFSADSVAAVVAKEYGLHGDLTQLVSERDQNFRLKCPDGQNFVVKVTSLTEDRVATDFQIAMLSHFKECGFDYTPRVVRTVSGQKRSVITSDAGQQYCLRVVTWLEGSLLHDVGLTTDNAGRLGQRLAELHLALEKFEFDGDGQAGLWDMQDALRLKEFLPHVNDEEAQRYTSDVLTQFENSSLETLRTLPVQAIHNDANPENILIDADGNVSGFIDFGDAIKAPRIMDVAIAASYLRAGGENPLELIEAFIEGYEQRSPLSNAEFDVLFDLIRTRLATTLILMYWRMSARDEDDPYRQKIIENESNAFEFLVLLSDPGREDSRLSRN